MIYIILSIIWFNMRYGPSVYHFVPHCRALVATRKVATSSPQQTRDDVVGVISKSRHGDVAAILTTNKVTPQTIHRCATANAFTEIWSISEDLPLPPPHSRTVVPLHCLTAFCRADRVRWSIFCLGVYPLSIRRHPHDVLIDRPLINA